ncbi:ESCRT-II complex subunit-domain-containing protein [Naematelia encephala]|uniref:ESCRT-II complex subunit VPS25 n=1 Tax=Naematelia encephala TaxID=71784 RepID=A0A1Y2AEB0_9TREE|nr:ESCRT-II complex subunit-domain-containing protein [Naematelia encephala]
MSSFATSPFASTSSQATSTSLQPLNDGEKSPSPPTPLRPVISSTGFEYPAIWSFPPFFTIQPNPSTQTHQIQLWTALILSWAQHDRIWEINVDAADGGGEVFWNRTISRRLLPASIRAVLGQMVKDGQAVPEPAKQTSTYLLYWRRPEEWGNLIYDWISDNGMTNTILTFYEITDGDLSHTTEFREMPPNILRRALDTLIKKGKAQILSGLGEAGEGVRFL